MRDRSFQTHKPRAPSYEGGRTADRGLYSLDTEKLIRSVTYHRLRWKTVAQFASSNHVRVAPFAGSMVPIMYCWRRKSYLFAALLTKLRHPAAAPSLVKFEHRFELTPTKLHRSCFQLTSVMLIGRCVIATVCVVVTRWRFSDRARYIGLTSKGCTLFCCSTVYYIYDMYVQ